MFADNRLIKRIVFVLVVAGIFLSWVEKAGAYNMLIGPRDIISASGSQSFAYHEVRFGISDDGEPVLTTDYVFIELTNFTGITEPTSMTGRYTGVPVYSVIGNRIRITGVHINPGSSVSFSGITAYNPESLDQFDVYIWISSDPDGFSVKYFAHILASPTDGTVLMSATIRAEVGSLRITGYGAPSMFVNFAENGVIIGTAIANSSGVFSQIFPGLSPMVHTILVFGTDADNRNTSPTVVEVFPRPYEVTDVSGIILSPTINVDKEAISPGESITISGSGVPGYTAKVFTEPPLNSFEMVIDGNGDFNYVLADTSSLDYGDHQVYALIQDGLGTQSLFGPRVFFRVTSASEPPDPGETPDFDISHGDLNNDGNIDLVDFSILLYYWSSANAAADINADGNVDLIDFSIMMFYWGT